jgi:hypothetical protein
MKTRLLMIFAFLASFAGTALAADAIDTDSSSVDIAKAIYDAFAGHHYAYAAAIAVILIVALVKRYLGPKVAWLHSDAGGSVLVLAGATATAMASSLAGGGPVTLDLFKTAAMVGVGAAGGYALLKNLIINPFIVPLAAKAPAWAQPILGVILAIFDKATPTETATAAGNAAVTATPAAGVSAVLPTATVVK